MRKRCASAPLSFLQALLYNAAVVTISLDYQDDLHTRAVHGPSGKVLETDAPKDNEGRGESFSPTDLLATALGACMMTIMGIVARRHQIGLKGARVTVDKHMQTEPVRRIGKLVVNFQMPAGISTKHRQILENAAFTCPVHKSLHPDIEIPVEFKYPD